MIKSFLCACLCVGGLILALPAAAGTSSSLVITIEVQSDACGDQARQKGKERQFSPAPDLGGRSDVKRPKSKVIPGLLI